MEIALVEEFEDYSTIFIVEEDILILNVMTT